MDPATVAWLDQQDAWMRSTVRDYGWAVEYVGAGTCSHPGCDGGDPGVPFGYTVGLHGVGHPELLLFGCEARVTQHALNAVAAQVMCGTDLLHGQRCAVEGWQREITAVAVPNPEQILFAAYRFYRCDRPGAIEALQLCWSDTEGRFPWQDGCAPDARRQPPPGEFAA